MRNLKKFLAVLVVVAMMATSMIPAFAADEPELTPIEVVENLGLVVGEGDGLTDEYLAKDTTRMQAALIMLKAFGLYEEAAAFDGEDNFADADDVVWGEGQNVLAYLKATENDGWDGNPDGTFEPFKTITAQQYYKVMLELLGYSYADGDYDWDEVLTVAAEAGMAGAADYEDDAVITNNDMAEILYEALYAPVKDAEDENDTLLVYLASVNETLAAKAEELGLIVVEPDEITATAAATGAKKLTVTFNQAVDTTKATFSVKKGSNALSVSSVAWNDEKDTATLTLASRLTAGDYVISVAGLGTIADMKVTAEDEKVAKITINSLNAAIDRSVATRITTSYSVFNQYDEDITSTASGLTFTAGKGNVTTPSAGNIQIDSTVNYTLGEKVSLSILHAATGTFKTDVLTVVESAKVADVSFVKLFNTADNAKTTPVAGETAGDYKIIFKAVDQYGADITSAANVKSDIMVTSTNAAVADVTRDVYENANVNYGSIDGSNQLYFTLDNISAGTAKINVISKITGKMQSFDITVKETVAVDTITLSAPEIAVAGETVTIPYTAVDQFGNAVADPTALNAISVSYSVYGVTGTFTKDYVKNVTNFNVNLGAMTAKGSLTITMVTPKAKVSLLTINVVDPAVPTTVSGIKDTKTVYAKNAYEAITAADVVVKDQYGRDYDESVVLGTAANDYRLFFETSDSGKVSVVGDTYVDNATLLTSDVTLFGYAKGSSTITIKLQKNDAGTWKDVADSAYTFTARTVEKSEIASYEVADIAKVYADYDGANTHHKDVVVNGKLADGTLVALPNDGTYYSVDVANDHSAKVGYDSVNGYVYADSTVADLDSNNETKSIAVVTVFSANGPVVLTKEFAVTTAAPVVATLGYDGSKSFVTVEDATANVVSVTRANANAHSVTDIVNDVLSAKDQYDVTVGFSYTAYDSNYTDASRTVGLHNLNAGDTFNITVITSNGKVIVMKVIVK